MFSSNKQNPPPPNLENIRALLLRDDLTLDLLLEEPSLEKFIIPSNLSNPNNSTISLLVKFLFENLADLFDLATSPKNKENSLKKKARGVCISLAENYPAQFSENEIFHQKLDDILLNNSCSSEDGNKIDHNTVVTISKLLLVLGTTQNYSILANVSESQNAISEFFSLINFNSVFETLHNLSGDDSQAIQMFFEDVYVATVLLNVALSDKQTSLARCRALKILINLLNNTEHESTYINEIIESYQKIFQLAINLEVDRHINSSAFDLLQKIIVFTETNSEKMNDKLDILSDSDFDSYSDSDHSPVNFSIPNTKTLPRTKPKNEHHTQVNPIEFLRSNIDKICNFILLDDSLSFATVSSLYTLTSLIKKQPQETPIHESVFNMAEKLLKRLFIHPLLTIVHNSFKKFFITLTKHDKSFFSKLDIKNTILEYMKTKCINFDGFVYWISEQIKENENQTESDEEWNHFLETDLYDYLNIINKSYGGPMPDFHGKSYLLVD